MRENLIELLKSADDLPVVETYESFADYLIDNDVVPVVRCKDCKYQSKIWIEDKRRKEKGYYIYGCNYQEMCEVGYDDDFCSYGERKENERKAD